MPKFYFVLYVEKGFPSTDYKSAVCLSKKEVKLFQIENKDIDIIGVAEQDSKTLVRNKEEWLIK